MTDPDIPGPIDFLLVEYPGDRLDDASSAALFELIEQGTVRLFDLAVVRKGTDGSWTNVDFDGDTSALGGFAAFAGARSGLLSPEDIEQAGAAMDPGTTAILVVFENTWAIPFVAAAHAAGGQVIASQRITAQELLDALDAAEASD
jgi:Family of unknown function (DUF6325)